MCRGAAGCHHTRSLQVNYFWIGVALPAVQEPAQYIQVRQAHSRFCSATTKSRNIKLRQCRVTYPKTTLAGKAKVRLADEPAPLTIASTKPETLNPKTILMSQARIPRTDLLLDRADPTTLNLYKHELRTPAISNTSCLAPVGTI